MILDKKFRFLIKDLSIEKKDFLSFIYNLFVFALAWIKMWNEISFYRAKCSCKACAVFQ